MLLNKLLNDVPHLQITNNFNPNILGVKFNSKEVKKGDLFVCLKGEVDGATFLDEAIKNGAVACVCEDVLDTIIPVVVVENARKALSLICKNFYGCACDEFKIVMVTGTNGKTTTSYILYSILQQNKTKCALIGTNGIFVDNKQIYYGLTTPDPTELHYYFEVLKKMGVTHIVMEASAHAIKLNKLCGIKAKQIIFTNLTNEHLDYFGTMENYAKTKLDFFSLDNANLAITNVDDDYGVTLLNKKMPVISYGLKNPADTFCVDINSSIMGLTFCANVMDEIIEISSSLVGLYNVYNILAAITSAHCLGVDAKTIKQGVKNLKNIAGRFNKFLLDLNNLVVVDFAHTPDGFFNVLSEIKKLRQGKIITVFGCVGYSDVEKRKQMGEVASKFSDEIVLTSDNPNFAKFDDICLDILKGVSVPYTKIFDRFSAVKFAFSKLTKNTTLVLLGKGAETSNLINGVKVPYSEVKAVETCIEEFYNVKKGEGFGNSTV